MTREAVSETIHDKMKITLLGTGDAIGTPKIGCSCSNCTYAVNHGLERLRTSLLVETDGHHLLVDSSPDLRRQLLKSGSPHIDAVIWTHGHYDHFLGYGEFYRVQDLPTVYAPQKILDYCRQYFHFLPYEDARIEPYKSFSLFGLEITMFEVNHPPAYTCGVLIDTGKSRVAYTADTRKDIPKRSKNLLNGVDMLFVDAIAPSGYDIFKHMNYDDAEGLATEVGAKDYICVHQAHMVSWDNPHSGKDMDEFLFN